MSGARIAVLGGGAWGTALALVQARAGHDVRLWARDPAIVVAIGDRHENPRYLPGIRFDEEITTTTDLAAALDGVACALVVTPAQTVRAVLSQARAAMAPDIPVVLCAKGIERETGRLISEIAREVLPGNPLGALSGPSFAADVARGLPTAVTVAADDADRALGLAGLLSAPGFRCYASDDIVGVEIGGALKNVLAIAAGAVVGAGLGASAQAAIVTRGFVELRRVGEAFGARAETLMGLSGLGDLILTCGSPQSRNFAYGLALGHGDSLSGLRLAEGVATAAIALRLATERGIEVPIIGAVDAILSGDLTISDAVSALMARPLRNETD